MSKKMKTKAVIPFGDEKLRAVCPRVEVFHKGLHEKVDLLKNTLRSHEGGAALAAPQIAMLKQIIVIDYLGEYFELINPEVLESSGAAMDHEGCLSLPGFWGRVERYERLTVRYQDRNGNAHTVEVKKQMARCFQHEIDHLHGILFIDRMADDYVIHEQTNHKVPIEKFRELTKRTTP